MENNIVDNAKVLAQQLQETPQYKNLERTWNNLKQNDNAATKYDELEEHRVQWLQNEDFTDHNIIQWSETVESIMQSMDELKAFDDAENEMGTLIQELVEILTNPLHKIYND